MIVGPNKFYILMSSFDFTILPNGTFYAHWIDRKVLPGATVKPENERVYWYRLIFGVNNFDS